MASSPQGTRELVVSGTPDVIGYCVKLDAVAILRLLYSAPRWRSRL